MNKQLVVVAILVAAGAVAAGLLAGTSSGAPKAQRTIGLVLPDPNGGDPLSAPVEQGANAAASALGDSLVIIPADGPAGMTSAVNSLVAQHAAAIAVNTDQGYGTVKQVLPALAQARAAGIPTLSYEQQFPGSVWVPQSTPQQYAQALADALASQMSKRGQFVIVACRPAETIVTAWLKAAKAYMGSHYPRMHRVGIVYGGTGNGAAGTLELRPLLKKYPHLRGLILLCPSESFTVPPQIVHAHKVGKLFSSGNGQDCPPLFSQLANNVRSGAEEVVCAGDPVNLGYLTVWAADHLAGGQAFTPGSYDVGGPVGSVTYQSLNEELPLGRPITITQANLTQYTG
ncbi:MAG TPA: substrate-binding domain-containing protein [Gaiellaceae bacterium]|nr:substrate-binding domain-containing protein [Gaiellaceae bacterium]